MMLAIGPYRFPNNLALAPMAGVTDRPFRILCKQLGAGLAVSEMVASNPALRNSRKSRLRRDHDGEVAPRIIQIAGAEPAWMAEAARYNVAQGAQIIDINMGCPAKKVCNRAAGSALLSDPALVRDILQATVESVAVPVTLKFRSGPSADCRNAVEIAELAESCGIAGLALHGRTRADAYRGHAEYDTIRAVKQAVSIPVLANGDIDSPEKALGVLEHTGADGLMIGRAAQGRPWLFREIAHYLDTGEELPAPSMEEIAEIMLGHLRALHAFYGETQGVRVARKHIGWYLADQPDGATARRQLVRMEGAREQLDGVSAYFRGRGHARCAA